MEFKEFSDLIEKRFNELSKEDILYSIDLDRNALWDIYLGSFPEGTDPVYKTNTRHNCNCCKNFIRDVGDVVAIKNGKLITLWDVPAEGVYKIVSENMAAFVKKQKIKNIFQHEIKSAGAKITRQQLADGTVKSWNHFHCEIPSKFVSSDNEKLNYAVTTVGVFERGLQEISLEAIDTVLDLISQNSLYRGEEHADSVKSFKKLFDGASLITDDLQKNLFLWANYTGKGVRIKNTVIGSLLMDLSEGVDIDKAVASFESKVAPTNYKRPTAAVTKGMIDRALKTISDLGIEQSLYRRFAVPEDLSLNNVLFADRSTAEVMKGGLSDILMKEVKSNKDYSKTEEISIDDFIVKVLPNVTSMELLFENRHVNNLTSVIAPKHPEASCILKWDNNFSWSYNGNIADSIKERVKNAGGSVEGELRVSLGWFNTDDLDLHVIEPSGTHIYFRNKKSYETGGTLDIDMNYSVPYRKDAVENIVWSSKARIQKGVYKVVVDNYTRRETQDIGFELQLADKGKVANYIYDKSVIGGMNIEALTFMWNGDKITDIELGKDIKESSFSKEVWGIDTAKFHKVNILTISPNHWDDQNTGNKHYFFILDGCLNDSEPRGFYNEFLKSDLDKHRKAFELISNKTKCEMSDRQLSGLGFSSTKHDSIVCKVSGNFNRTLKIIF